MLWSTLPFLFASATAASPPAPRYEAVATVKILAAEEIRFDDMQVKQRTSGGKATIRQTRIRDGMPMVEFY